MTGITPEILAANDARSFREVWPLFAQWLSEVQAEVEEASGEGEEADGIVLVAHNANFDNRFLVQEQERCGFDRCVCFCLLFGRFRHGVRENGDREISQGF